MAEGSFVSNLTSAEISKCFSATFLEYSEFCITDIRGIRNFSNGLSDNRLLQNGRSEETVCFVIYSFCSEIQVDHCKWFKLNMCNQIKIHKTL